MNNRFQPEDLMEKNFRTLDQKSVVIDCRERFNKGKRLAPLVPRLTGIVLRNIKDGLEYDELKEAVSKLVSHPRFPDITLDEEQFVALERQCLEMDGWDQNRKREAHCHALYHFRKCTGVDPYFLHPLGDPEMRRRNRQQLHAIIGILSMAWHFHQGGTREDLVLNLQDYRRVHQD